MVVHLYRPSTTTYSRLQHCFNVVTTDAVNATISSIIVLIVLRMLFGVRMESHRSPHRRHLGFLGLCRSNPDRDHVLEFGNGSGRGDGDDFLLMSMMAIMVKQILSRYHDVLR